MLAMARIYTASERQSVGRPTHFTPAPMPQRGRGAEKVAERERGRERGKGESVAHGASRSALLVPLPLPLPCSFSCSDAALPLRPIAPWNSDIHPPCAEAAPPPPPPGSPPARPPNDMPAISIDDFEPGRPLLSASNAAASTSEPPSSPSSKIIGSSVSPIAPRNSLVTGRVVVQRRYIV
eukprot:365467-Chlamydomonas_euryale.AAC.9